MSIKRKADEIATVDTIQTDTPEPAVKRRKTINTANIEPIGDDIAIAIHSRETLKNFHIKTDNDMFGEFVCEFMDALESHVSSNKHLPFRYRNCSFNYAERLVIHLVSKCNYICTVNQISTNLTSDDISNDIIVHPSTWYYNPVRSSCTISQVEFQCVNKWSGNGGDGINYDIVELCDKLFTRKNITK